MLTFGTHFEELLKRTQPPGERLEAARELPPRVREYLQKHAEFTTLSPHSRLVGSYAQGTCVGDVKDVDFLVRVPGDPQDNQPQAKALIQDLKRALDGLPEALGYEGWAGVDIERARRSVHVYIRGRDFHLDVVPCIAPNGFDDVLYVPDRGYNKWIPSHPVGYVDLLNRLNDTSGGKVKNLLRLLKHFRNQHMQTRRPKSYWLGALVVHHVQKQSGLVVSQPFAVLFRDLMDAVYAQYDHLLSTSDTATPNIPDPMLGHNISWNWTRTHFETWMRRVDDARRWASRALEIHDDREAAIVLWQKVFGAEYFPSDVTEAASRAAVENYPGRSYVSRTGSISPNRLVSAVQIATKATTFHGPKQD